MKRNLEAEAQVMFLMGSSDEIYLNISSLKDLDDEFCEEHGTCNRSLDEILHAVLMLSDDGCVTFVDEKSFRITRQGYSLYAHEIG